jgi:transcriptional regulator with XRE-family HTH domain
MGTEKEVGGVDDTYARQLGLNLRHRRAEKGLSLRAVEEVSGGEFKAAVLSAYERGQRAISITRFERLAELYGTTPQQLLPRTEDHEDDPDASPALGRRNSAAIDLDALANASGIEAELLTHLIRSIQKQRSRRPGAAITIRGDDLDALATVLGQTPEDLVARLEGAQILRQELSARASRS